MPRYDRTKSRSRPRTSPRPAPSARQVTSATAAVAIGTGANIGFQPREPARGDSRICDRGPDAHDADGCEHGHETDAAVPAGVVLDVAFGLQDQPPRGEKPIAEQQGDARQNREWRQEWRRSSRERPSRDLVSLNETPEHHALRKSGNARPVRRKHDPKTSCAGHPESETRTQRRGTRAQATSPGSGNRSPG